MDVCVINQELRRPKTYQVMVRVRCGFNHVCPGKLFTLEEAEEYCRDNGYNVVAVGTLWECLKQKGE